jgi:hypothetical protein
MPIIQIKDQPTVKILTEGKFKMGNINETHVRAVKSRKAGTNNAQLKKSQSLQ